ncbi:angiopoietin-1-like [Mya arenaria]|uniref:angiopoietin-1-like n=1 Tax=Mya arenaria TaxID=6604 RepID=UPI0022E07F98|nr:angiopoietin-1-like [Mya arenaria]
MRTRMVRLRFVVLLAMLTTCLADRLDVLESQMKRMKYFQSYVEVTLNTIEGNVGSLTERVSKLESIVATSGTDNDSNGSRAGSSGKETYTQLEIKDIKHTLEMYQHAFARQKQELIDVNDLVNNTLSVLHSNVSVTLRTVLNNVSNYVQDSAETISATLKKVNNTIVESGRQLRSDILIYLGNISSEIKTDMAMHIKGEKQENNKTLLALNSQVLKHIANETDTLETFRTNILQDIYAAREHVQNSTIELEKKVEELIGRANEVVGIIDEQRSTIEDGIMVTIRALHSSWSDWSAWSDCSQSCGKGKRSRYRSCDVLPPFTDGVCIGNDTDKEECVIQECPVDCYDLHKQNQGLPSGVYSVSLWRSHVGIRVFCDMTTASGGWTVIQHRYDGSVDFYRNLYEYTHGFGDVSTEFWLGLSYIKEIADKGNTTIRMEVSAADGSSAYEEWPEFRLGDAPTYTLHVGGRGTGTAGDYERDFERYNNGSDFTAKGSFCGDEVHGGWWYNGCTYINLNGEYVTPGTRSGYGRGLGGMVYYSFRRWSSLKTSTIMIKRND